MLFPENIHQTTQFESPNMELHALAYEFLIKNNGNAFLLTNDYLTLKLDKLIEQTSPEDFLLVFPNPSELEEKYGWSLRNLLAAIAFLKLKIFFYFSKFKAFISFSDHNGLICEFIH